MYGIVWIDKVICLLFDSRIYVFEQCFSVVLLRYCVLGVYFVSKCKIRSGEYRSIADLPSSFLSDLAFTFIFCLIVDGNPE